jgi:hypothetical protein
VGQGHQGCSICREGPAALKALQRAPRELVQKWTLKHTSLALIGFPLSLCLPRILMCTLRIWVEWGVCWGAPNSTRSPSNPCLHPNLQIPAGSLFPSPTLNVAICQPQEDCPQAKEAASEMSQRAALWVKPLLLVPPSGNKDHGIQGNGPVRHGPSLRQLGSMCDH